MWTTAISLYVTTLACEKGSAIVYGVTSFNVHAEPLYIGYKALTNSANKEEAKLDFNSQLVTTQKTKPNRI